MISLKDRNELTLFSIVTQPFTKQHILNNRDFISISLSFPFTEELYDKKLKIVKNLVNDRMIVNENNHYNILFDLTNGMPGTYKDWKFVIDYAKEHNMLIKLNTLYACYPHELKKYIDKFTKTNEKNEKELIFRRQTTLIKDNPFTQSNTSSLEELILNQGCEINDDLLESAKNLIESSNTNLLALTLSNANQFDKSQLIKTKELIDFLKTNYPNKKIDICFYSKHYYYTSDEFKNLLLLEKYIKKNYSKDYELKFYSGSTLVNKEQILHANSIIKKVANQLKKSSLSPYEKLIYVRKLLTEKEYNFKNSASQDIYSVLNSNQMVCVSYSLIFNAIFEELNDPNIKVTTQIYQDSDKEDLLHALNNVYVNDEKYNIEGYYDLDLTMSPSNLLTKFMVPTEDTFNATSTKTRSKVDYFRHCTLLDNRRTCYFNRHIDEHDKTLNNTTINNTLKHLNTPMGRQALTKAQTNHTSLFEAIWDCLDKSKPIPIETTKKALETVSQKCFDMNEVDAKAYTSNVIYETIFNSIFNYDRAKCKNTFATESLEIEKGNVSLTKSNNPRR